MRIPMVVAAVVLAPVFYVLDTVRDWVGRLTDWLLRLLGEDRRW